MRKTIKRKPVNESPTIAKWIALFVPEEYNYRVTYKENRILIHVVDSGRIKYEISLPLC